jgi:23S rRNA pseudouridine1911/1915/1917 synthase
MKTDERSERFVVAAEDAGQRLDRWLAARLPELSRTRVQELIAEGRVRVNGAAARASHKAALGDRVEVEVAPRPAAKAQAEDIPLAILYEDDDVVVVNKPAGMIVHVGAGKAAQRGTLVNALLHRYRQLAAGGGALRPGIVHRLDKETSGAVVIARSDAAHRSLAEQFHRRAVKKTYLTLVHGRLKSDSGMVELPVARDLHRRTRMTTRRREGRAALTRWRALLRIESGARAARTAFTLAEVDLLTGRTHQIRVHFSALGHPVVGDTLYGAPAQPQAGGRHLAPLGRNFLHAARICFYHPRRGEPVEVRAPLAQELRAYLQQLAAAAGVDADSVDAALQPFL